MADPTVKYFEALGDDQTAKENLVDKKYSDTVQLIEDFVDGKSLKELEADLADKKSDGYTRFATHDKQSLGVILFTAKKLYEYIKTLNTDTDTDQIGDLEILKGCMVGLYKDPVNNLDKLDELVVKTNKLLTQYDSTLVGSENKAVTDMCKSLFTLAKTLSITIDNLGFAKRSIASKKIDLAKLTSQINGLVERTEKTIGIISPSEVSKTVEEHLDESLELVGANFLVPEELEDQLIRMNARFDELDTKLQALAKLKEMQSVVNTNMNKGMGEYPESFSAVIGIAPKDEAKRLDFNNIIKSCSEEEQKYWQARIQDLENPTIVRQGYDAVSSAASVVKNMTVNGTVFAAEATAAALGAAATVISENKPDNPVANGLVSTANTTLSYAQELGRGIWGSITGAAQVAVDAANVAVEIVTTGGLDITQNTQPVIQDSAKSIATQALVVGSTAVNSGVKVARFAFDAASIGYEVATTGGHYIISELDGKSVETTSQTWLESLRGAIPATQDSEDHDKFSSLLASRIDAVASDIAGNNAEFKQSLVEAPTAKVIELKEKTNIIQEIFTIDKQLISHIQKNNSKFVQFANWFKEKTGKGWFQTTKAKLVKHKQDLRDELSQLKEQEDLSTKFQDAKDRVEQIRNKTQTADESKASKTSGLGR